MSSAAPDSAPSTSPDAPRPRTGRSLAAAAGSIAAITLVARIVGFGRWFVFSHSVGATCVGSVYQSVNAVPNVLFEIAAGGVLAAVAVPLVAGFVARGDAGSADRTASALLGWSLAILVPLGVLVALAATPIASALLGSSAECPDAVALGTDLLRVFAVQIPLYGIGIVLAGVLQSHGRFIGAALAPLLSSLVVIATYLAYRSLVADPTAPIDEIPTEATFVLGLGTTLGVAALSLPLLVPARRAGIRLRPTLGFPAGVAARVRRLAVAGLLAVAGQQVATLVIIRLANVRGGPGTLNVYTYVQAVSLLPYAVLAVPIATAAFPTLAGQSAESISDAARATLRGTWLATVVVGLFSAGLLVAVARPVGAFFTALDAGRSQPSGAAALAAIPATLAAIAPGIAALSAIGLLSRASYVRGRARAAGLAVALGWVATTVIPIVGAGPDAGPDRTLRLIGVGTSVGLLLAVLALVVLVSRAWGASALRLPVRSAVAGAAGAAAAGAAGWSVGGAWSTDSTVGAAAACVACALVGVIAFAAVGSTIDRSVVRGLVSRVRPHVRTGKERT